MAHANPARHLFHVVEQYRTAPAAVRRVAQVNVAGYRAYMVDLAGTLPAGRRFVVHISEGKRGDLRGLPKPKGVRA